jgi:hypothetical protein
MSPRLDEEVVGRVLLASWGLAGASQYRYMQARAGIGGALGLH